MKLKIEAVKKREDFFELAKSYSLKTIFMKVIYFIAGILISRGNIFGSYYPFGISFSASVPGRLIAPTIFGAITGYLFPFNLNVGIRYISTVIAIGAIRWALNDLTQIKNHFLYIPALAFISSFVTGIAVNSAEGLDAGNFSVCVLESLVAAGVAFFFDSSFKILSSKKIYALNIKEFTYLAVSFSILLLSLDGLVIGGISLGRIFAIVMILITSYLMGVSGGGISGIASGVIFSLPSFGFTYISGSYAFGGMIAGLVSSWGKVGVSFAFIFANALVSFQSGDMTKMIYGIYESLIAMIIFLIVPESVFNKIKGMTPSFLESKKYNGIKNAVFQKLHYISKSIGSVPFFIEKTSFEILKSSEKPNFKSVCMDKIYSSCSSCGLCSFCWSKERNLIYENLNKVIDLTMSEKSVTYRDFTPEFLNRCHKTDMLIEKIERCYLDFKAKKNAQIKIDEFKKIMSEQIGGMGSMVENVAEDINEFYDFDVNLGEKIKSDLFKCGIEILNIVCFKNEDKKLFLDIECDPIISNKFDKKLINRMSELCGRRLSGLIVNNYRDTCRIQICEEKNYQVDFGFSQHSFNNGNFCGDSCSKFEDGMGNFNVIISDGMGTGSSAAVQGAMTSELMKYFIKSGVNFNFAIKFVNSSLLLNSEEENLSTLDAVSVNLFNGKAKFMKAGAPATFIVRNDEIIKVNFESLPIGILNDVSFSSEQFQLFENDLVVMLSDGVLDMGEDWVIDIIKSKNYNNATELSKLIVKKAVLIRKESHHDDDITAAVIRILNK